MPNVRLLPPIKISPQREQSPNQPSSTDYPPLGEVLLSYGGSVSAPGNPITVRGTTYSSPIGTPLDVEWTDAQLLIANGWTPVARDGGRGSTEPGQVGTTAQRPTAGSGGRVPLVQGTQYVDTTLGAIIVWDGSNWRNAITGEAV